MKNMIAWILNMTKIGKTAKAIQVAVDGKKQMLAGLIAGLTATATIITKFGELGTPYLLSIATTPEFAAATVGWTAFFNALKGEKIRAENAQIIANQEKLDLGVVGKKPE